HLVHDATAQSGLQYMKLSLAHCSFEAEQEPVVEARWIVYAILVEDQRVRERADFKEPVPVGVVPGQARDLETHHDPRASHPHVGDQALKSLAPGGGRARLALVAVDDDDLVVGPTERSCAATQRVLTLRAFDVLDDLAHR